MEVRPLRAWRLRAGLSAAELAARAGLHPLTVRKLERGRPGRPATWRRLAEALGIRPDQLREVEAAVARLEGNGT